MKKTAAVRALVLTACASLFFACASARPLEAVKYPGETTVSSYIRTWPLGSTIEDQAAGKHWEAKDIHAEYLTDLIVAFAHVNAKDGTLSFPDADNAERPFANLWEETEKLQKRFPALRVHVSVGGWGAGGFSETAADDAKRATFVAEIMALAEKRNLAGIDIDWEYPVGPDWGQEIPSSPADAENFVKLLSDIRTGFDALGKKTGKAYSISIAAPASPWYAQKIDVKKVASIVDSLKLMSYDYYGPWSATTGHLANLSNNPADPAWGGWSTEQAVQVYLDAGVSPEKLTVGLAFYGRAWRGVADGGTHGLFQKPAESAYPDGLSWPDLKGFLASGSGYTRYWDDAAKAPFLYNGDVFVTYTDAEAIAGICAFAKGKGLGGVMIWEYGHDLDAELLAEVSASMR